MLTVYPACIYKEESGYSIVFPGFELSGDVWRYVGGGFGEWDRLPGGLCVFC